MIGKILGGRYELTEKIGEGGMAVVYKAHCKLLDRFVAVKILKDEFGTDEEFIKKFRRESQASASLSDPYIVNVYDVGEEESEGKKIYYIVMEYVDGKTLKEIIKQEPNIPIAKVIDYSVQIASALKAAHLKHIVHRDIKPHNILITNQGQAKVTDFGIARAVTSSTITTTSNVLGSVHYFSPEQARGGYTDEKSDIYSLGVVMYELATGTLPYDGETPINVALKHVQEQVLPPSEIRHDLPAALEDIILKCMEKRQADRYKNVGELIQDLKKVEAQPLTEQMKQPISSDDRTIVVPIVHMDIPSDESTTVVGKTEGNDMKVKNNRKSGKKTTIIQVIAGIALALLLFGFFVLVRQKFNSFFASSEISVPKVVGMEVNKATDLLTKWKLKYSISEVENAEVKAGVVISQEQPEGTLVKEGFPVALTVSKGAGTVPVPNVVNQSIDDANYRLVSKGFVVNAMEIKYEYSDKIPKDVVISQSPEGNSEAEKGTNIHLVVSKGKESESIEMPHLIGKKLDEAKKMLEEKGITNYKTKKQSNTQYDADVVSWQSIEAGERIGAETELEIFVSVGKAEEPKETEPKPKEDPATEPDPSTEEPDPNGLKVLTLTLFPLSDEATTNVEIIKVYEGVSETVFTGVMQQGGDSLTVNLKGKSGTFFDILYNGKYQSTQSIP